MALKPEQKEFIEQKVKELGSLEAAEAFYCAKKPISVVAKYAMKQAKKLYKEAK
ncbi:hypothetical protein LCGC14_0458800 [marine sediment metagenome]|uniref:Uncharacterized protein n=1 Tax=marine sediment metagenome TaxID=412755 RepID=A0A0F9SYL1_9ZZZZ